MFKSLRNFTLDKQVNRAKLKIIHTNDKHGPCTIVQLYRTAVVHRQNVNNVVTLNSGSWRTVSTKTCINTALKAIYGTLSPHVFQYKKEWYINLPGIQYSIKYFDGMTIGGGCGTPFIVLN